VRRNFKEIVLKVNSFFFLDRPLEKFAPEMSDLKFKIKSWKNIGKLFS